MKVISLRYRTRLCLRVLTAPKHKANDSEWKVSAEHRVKIGDYCRPNVANCPSRDCTHTDLAQHKGAIFSVNLPQATSSDIHLNHSLNFVSLPSLTCIVGYSAVQSISFLINEINLIFTNILSCFATCIMAE